MSGNNNFSQLLGLPTIDCIIEGIGKVSSKKEKITKENVLIRQGKIT